MITPSFDSAHIGTANGKKRYDSNRVIEIFRLCKEPSHSAFITNLKKPTCTAKEIDIAIEHHERAEVQIANEKKNNDQRHSHQIVLEEVAKNCRNRFMLKNTNTGRAYLLPVDFKPEKQYTNAHHIKHLKIDSTLKHRIASECNSIGLDQFVFEAVTKWNVHSIIDQVGESERA